MDRHKAFWTPKQESFDCQTKNLAQHDKTWINLTQSWGLRYKLIFVRLSMFSCFASKAFLPWRQEKPRACLVVVVTVVASQNVLTKIKSMTGNTQKDKYLRLTEHRLTDFWH